MDTVEKAMEFLRNSQGVIGAYIMDDDVSKSVLDVESSIRTRSNHEYRNVGYTMALNRQYRVCVFYSGVYVFEKRALVKLMTSDGTIMGTSLYPSQIEEYKKKDNLIWISEDFVVFTDIVGKGEEEFVLFPFDLPELEEAVPGCKNAIGVSPTTSSDMVLKEKAGIPITKEIFTSIVAFNIE